MPGWPCGTMRSASASALPLPRRWARRVRWVLARPLADQWLLLQALVLLGAARLAIRALPFPRLEPLIGTRSAESPHEVSAPELQQARRVAWTIRRISDHTPWTSNCFPQALTARWLLRRKGIDSTLYLGAAFRPDGDGLRAHAWSRCGELYMTGGDGAGEFGAVTSYA